VYRRRVRAVQPLPQGFYRFLFPKKEHVRLLLIVGAVVTMSLPFSGSKSKSAGLVSAIRKQTLLLNLKPVKKVSVKFDPFSQNAATAR